MMPPAACDSRQRTKRLSMASSFVKKGRDSSEIDGRTVSATEIVSPLSLRILATSSTIGFTSAGGNSDAIVE